MVLAKYAQPSLRLLLLHQGKVRNTYATRRGIAGAHTRLIYASDRISTHDVVHLSEVPKKGEVLTALTVFWLTTVLRQIPNHLVAYGSKIYQYLDGDPSEYPCDLHLRSLVVRELKMIPMEFVIRAYLAGSLYRDYVAHAAPNPYGHDIPYWTAKMTQFQEPIFTPTSKSDVKDMPKNAYVTYAEYPKATDLMFQAYEIVRMYANKRGIEIVDWKGEVGTCDGDNDPVIGVEIGTPDCCRFCELSEIQEAVEPKWLDKQILRDFAERMWIGGEKLPIRFPHDTLEQVSQVYLGIFKRLTGMELAEFQRVHMQ